MGVLTICVQSDNEEHDVDDNTVSIDTAIVDISDDTESNNTSDSDSDSSFISDSNSSSDSDSHVPITDVRIAND